MDPELEIPFGALSWKVRSHVDTKKLLGKYTLMRDVYNSKQSRIRKSVTFICSQTPCRLFAMLVSKCSIEYDLCFYIFTLCFIVYKMSFLPSFCVWSYVIAKVKGKIKNFSVLIVSVPYVWH